MYYNPCSALGWGVSNRAGRLMYYNPCSALGWALANKRSRLRQGPRAPAAPPCKATSALQGGGVSHLSLSPSGARQKAFRPQPGSSCGRGTPNDPPRVRGRRGECDRIDKPDVEWSRTAASVEDPVPAA